MLDLSAALDTVDHPHLTQRLREVEGVLNQALSWYSSLLHNGSSQVKLGPFTSIMKAVPCVVRQLYLLSPLQFNINIISLLYLIRGSGLSFHSYTDTPTFICEGSSAKPLTSPSLANCLRDIQAWTAANLLQWNTTKTEIIFFAPTDLLTL